MAPSQESGPRPAAMLEPHSEWGNVGSSLSAPLGHIGTERAQGPRPTGAPNRQLGCASLVRWVWNKEMASDQALPSVSNVFS